MTGEWHCGRNQDDLDNHSIQDDSLSVGPVILVGIAAFLVRVTSKSVRITFPSPLNRTEDRDRPTK